MANLSGFSGLGHSLAAAVLGLAFLAAPLPAHAQSETSESQTLLRSWVAAASAAMSPSEIRAAAALCF